MTNEINFILKDSFFSFESAFVCKTKTFDNHYHSWFEIYYLESGKGNYLIEDTLYEVHSGDIVLIPSNIIHKTSYSTPSHSRLLASLSSDYLPDYLPSFLNENNYIYRNPKIRESAYSILSSIESEYVNWDDHSQEMIVVYLRMFFVLLIRNTNYYKNERTGNNYIERILNDINKNYDSDISLAGTAREYSVSPEHLSRIFKKETGLNFHEYLISVRLRHAEHFLKQEARMSISDIAYACGFNDSNYFSYKFKSVYGVSPLQYRKRTQTGTA